MQSFEGRKGTKNRLKVLHKRFLYKQGYKFSYSDRVTIVFAGTAGKRTRNIAARISVEHKMAAGGSYKDDRSSGCVDVFSVDSQGRKKPINGSTIFLKDMTRNLGNTPFPAFVPHFTLDN